VYQVFKKVVLRPFKEKYEQFCRVCIKPLKRTKGLLEWGVKKGIKRQYKHLPLISQLPAMVVEHVRTLSLAAGD
jgi:hypothetical protein